MKPINFKIGEDDYQLLPHTGFEAMDLDRKVLGIVGQMARTGMFLDEEADAFAAMSGVFADMGRDDFRWIVETTLKNVIVVTPGKKNFTLSDFDIVTNHFEGRFNEIYVLLVKVWKEERLSPFAKAPKEADGSPTGQTR